MNSKMEIERWERLWRTAKLHGFDDIQQRFELRGKTLLEAGFRSTTVYWEGTNHRTGEGNGKFRPSSRGEACEGWIAYIVAER